MAEDALEFLKGYGGIVHEDSYSISMDTEDAKKALADYAKDQSIAFAEYCAKNGWYFNKIKRWSNRNENSGNLIETLSATKSTEDLYEIFLQQQLLK